MIYVISIDWLAIHCHFSPALKPLVSDDTDRQEQPQTWSPEDTPAGNELFASAYTWRYRQERFATRQFSELWRVSTPNTEGGWDEFAEIQAHPYSGILNRNSVIVRFVNRALYLPDFWERAEDLLKANEFEFNMSIAIKEPTTRVSNIRASEIGNYVSASVNNTPRVIISSHIKNALFV